MAAATVAAHVVHEVAVNVLVAYAGQVPLIFAPALAAPVTKPVVMAVAEVSTVLDVVVTTSPVVPNELATELTLDVVIEETKTLATPAQP